MVRIVAWQAVDPSSILGQRMFFEHYGVLYYYYLCFRFYNIIGYYFFFIDEVYAQQ